jgi:hypothetical protein
MYNMCMFRNPRFGVSAAQVRLPEDDYSLFEAHGSHVEYPGSSHDILRVLGNLGTKRTATIQSEPADLTTTIEIRPPLPDEDMHTATRAIASHLREQLSPHVSRVAIAYHSGGTEIVY